MVTLFTMRITIKAVSSAKKVVSTTMTVEQAETIVAKINKGRKAYLPFHGYTVEQTQALRTLGYLKPTKFREGTCYRNAAAL